MMSWETRMTAAISEWTLNKDEVKVLYVGNEFQLVDQYVFYYYCKGTTIFIFIRLTSISDDCFPQGRSQLLICLEGGI